ncbi:cytochrome P450 84A1-like [Argentina anserina]|uniref:cytochrome P450 84A1-like n=1 Tax=Argentina anserina TaxID=57926 RepID=UPI00217626B3|nr:cytochrome P450 84A1-like [Potentilla anserina]
MKMQDVMFGGTETVASVIEWTLAELMKCPEYLKKVEQELVDVVGLNRRVQETDLENLTYLKCAVKETLRRDPSAWDEPEKFKPSRFLEDRSPDFKGSDFEFIPFGSGRRSCPGMALGLYGLEMAVVHLLHCFKWDLPNGMKVSELDMNGVFGLTAPELFSLLLCRTKVELPALKFITSDEIYDCLGSSTCCLLFLFYLLSGSTKY